MNRIQNPNQRTVSRTLLLVLCAVLWSGLLRAETQVSISASDNLATIGDRINVKLLVKTTQDVDKLNFVPEEMLFETVGETPTTMTRQSEYVVFEKNVQVAFFKTGDYNIGPFKVELYKGDQVIETKRTNAVPVSIKTVLTDEDKDVKPLKDPVDIKGNPFYILKYVILAVVLLLLIWFVFWYIRKRRNAGPPVQAPLLSPLQELETRIRDLDAQNLLEKGKLKLHFIELTRILKHFLFRTYHFHAEDFTTYETMNTLNLKEADGVIQDNLRFLFDTADLVKFAKFEPDNSVFSEVTGKIHGIVSVYRERAAVLEQHSRQEMKR